MDYKLKDLFIMIGEIRIMNIVWATIIMLGLIILYHTAATLIETYKYKKKLKERNKRKEKIKANEDYEILKDRMYNRAKEDLRIENLKNDIDKNIMKEVMKSKEIITEEPILKEPVPEDKFIIKKAEKVTKKRMGRPIGTYTRSNDKELYPEIFEEMYKRCKELISEIGVTQLGSRIGLSGAAIFTVTRKEIQTAYTAKKYIKSFKKVKKDLEDNVYTEHKDERELAKQELLKIRKDQLKKIEEELSPELIVSDTDSDKKELNRLIDYLLSQMPQHELATRIGYTQPMISDISRRKVKKPEIIKMYIQKLRRVEDKILGVSLTHNSLLK